MSSSCVLYPLNNLKRSSSSSSTQSEGPFKIERLEVPQRSPQNGKYWNKQEWTKYFVFLEVNGEKMEGKPHFELWDIYQQMEKFVSTKNFRQCKTKHQRMLIQYKSVSEILNTFLHGQLLEGPILTRQRANILRFYEKQNLGSSKNFKTQCSYEEDQNLHPRPTCNNYQVVLHNKCIPQPSIPFQPSFINMKEESHEVKTEESMNEHSQGGQFYFFWIDCRNLFAAV